MKNEKKHITFDFDDLPLTLDKDKIMCRGIGLKKSEYALIDELANKLGVSSHSLMAYSIREQIKRYKNGEMPQIQVQVKLVNT